jgi:SAM-dependent methyltransferase
MLEGASARELQVVQSSATQIPFPDNCFDLVYSFKVLAHIPDLKGALCEMVRVLKPGGQMALEFYNRRSLRYLIRRLRPAGKVAPDTDESQVFTRFDHLAELKAQMPADLLVTGTAGLRVVTLLPQVFRVPGVGRLWEGLENLLSASPLKAYGGFLVVLARKRE